MSFFVTTTDDGRSTCPALMPVAIRVENDIALPMMPPRPTRCARGTGLSSSSETSAMGRTYAVQRRPRRPLSRWRDAATRAEAVYYH